MKTLAHGYALSPEGDRVVCTDCGRWVHAEGATDRIAHSKRCDHPSPAGSVYVTERMETIQTASAEAGPTAKQKTFAESVKAKVMQRRADLLEIAKRKVAESQAYDLSQPYNVRTKERLAQTLARRERHIAALHAITDPMLWLDAVKTVESFEDLFERLLDHDPSAIAEACKLWAGKAAAIKAAFEATDCAVPVR